MTHDREKKLIKQFWIFLTVHFHSFSRIFVKFWYHNWIRLRDNWTILTAKSSWDTKLKFKKQFSRYFETVHCYTFFKKYDFRDNFLTVREKNLKCKIGYFKINNGSYAESFSPIGTLSPLGVKGLSVRVHIFYQIFFTKKKRFWYLFRILVIKHQDISRYLRHYKNMLIRFQKNKNGQAWESHVSYLQNLIVCLP